MSIFEIRDYHNNIICKCEAEYFKNAIELAVIQNISLQGANLQGENLEKANLRGANLKEANLQGTNLQGANLEGANLQFAYALKVNLERTNLKRADLEGVNLAYANLQKVNLGCAILKKAYLRGAFLYEANLHAANLQHANLNAAFAYKANFKKANINNVNFCEANLVAANFAETNLVEAYLKGAIFYRANFGCAELPKFQIPQRKSLIVYKKLRDEAIATLRIPSRAARTASLSSNSPEMRSEGKFGKCRAEQAFVVAIEDREGKPANTGKSWYNDNFIYEVGKEVKPTQNYNPDIRVECTSGVHFFMTKEEAEEFKY
jgi:uncharacterized protein YjbI with pentapeptide repeats